MPHLRITLLVKIKRSQSRENKDKNLKFLKTFDSSHTLPSKSVGWVTFFYESNEYFHSARIH